MRFESGLHTCGPRRFRSPSRSLLGAVLGYSGFKGCPFQRVRNCGVPILRFVMSSRDPLLSPRSGVVANPPTTHSGVLATLQNTLAI